MSPASRRNTLLFALAALATVLVGGRWAAIETAERAWAASLGRPGGDVYLEARDLARLLHGVVLALAIGWGVGNLYYVYRAIGSVQLPRRLGDLEIVEAVPQRTLLAGAIAAGLIYGLLLSLGSGDWWLQTLLASKPPHFGLVDPVLHRDLGYYVGQLPWAVTSHRFALRSALSAILVVGLLYGGIGSLRFAGWRPVASAYARGHLGVLLAFLAVVLARGAALDPGEVVAGLHGGLDRGALGPRIAGAPVVQALALIAIVVSLIWAVRDRPRLLGTSWGALLLASLAVYLVLPSMAHGDPSTPAGHDDQLERMAFGAEWREGETIPRGFSSVASAVARIPVWDADRVSALARRAKLWSPHAAVAGTGLALLSPREGPPQWLVAPTPDGGQPARDSGGGTPPPSPDWRALHRGAQARAGRALIATELDSGLLLAPLATRESVFWFGPGFREFAVAAPDTWPETRTDGIPLEGWWRRTALAWVLQSPELTRRETNGLVLLWRRDVSERLTRLAPFATFDAPTPVAVNGALSWVSYGYLAGELFPLTRALDWPGGDRAVRYLRAGFVGVVDAATGRTRLYLAPGADSLAGTWARRFAPLVLPADSVPGLIRDALPYPVDAFRVAAAEILRTREDSGSWRPRPREPFELAAPLDSGGSTQLWMAQAFETGSPARFAGLFAATMSPRGPSVHLWSASQPLQLPAELLGSPETAPGILRLWTAQGTLTTGQGLFAQPATSGAPKGLSQVYLTWGDRASNGPTTTAALRALLTVGTHPSALDTSLASRWEIARRLAAAADSALAIGDLEAFARLYQELKQALGVGRALAPAGGRR